MLSKESFCGDYCSISGRVRKFGISIEGYKEFERFEYCDKLETSRKTLEDEL